MQRRLSLPALLSKEIQRYLQINLNRKEDRNAWYLCLEIFWASILGSAATFNAAFAIRLSATNTQVGLLSSIPALMAVLVSIPAGRFLKARSNQRPWLWSALTLHRTGFLLVALLPWLPLARIPQGLLVVAALVIMTIPAHFFNVGFIAMLGEIVPEHQRASVFAARNMVYNTTLSVFNTLFGLWLSRIVFPLNYQTMYIIGYATSMLSLYYLLKIQPIKPASTEKAARPTPIEHVARPLLARPLQARWNDLQQNILTHRSFMQLILNTLLHGLGLWMVAPLYILHYVRDLGASDAWIGLQGTVASLGTIAGFALWRRVMAQWGEPRTLKRMILTIGLFPIAVGLLPNLTLILIAIGLNGLIVPGVNLSHFNTLLKVTPAKERTEYTAWYMAMVNIGAFICPLIGVALANKFGIAPVLVGCGLFSIIGSTSFRVWPVQSAGQDA